MLLKFFGSRNENVPTNPNPSFGGDVIGEKPLILKIIHVGGMVERYFMAFPAAWIMNKYPNFVLARPEIFRRPWDSIVRPEEILVPGQKYFVVPIPTVKKLRRRMSTGMICHDKDTASSKSFSISKPKPVNRRVRIKGIESKTRNASCVAEDEGKKKKTNSNGNILRKKNVRFSSPLTIIDETRGFDD